MQTQTVLSLNGLTKSFGTVSAVKDVSLDLKQGEVLALLGENGAGKTTLMNMLFGHYLPDQGSVEVSTVDDQMSLLPLGDPQAAITAGIGMVHQHFTLAENLTAFDNITLGAEPIFSFKRHKTKAEKKINDLMQKSGLVAPLDVPISALTVGERQRIEILKALYREARILVLDEPTAVLTPQEADTLFENIRSMTAAGLSVIFISHKLREVLAFSNRIIVLRHGEKVGELATKAADEGKITKLMVGTEASENKRSPAKPGAPVLTLESLCVACPSRRNSLKNVNLCVHASEIVGIAGISGNGQSTLAELVSGMTKPDSGKIILDGAEIEANEPRTMIEAGVGRIPEDRHKDGIIGHMSVAENLVLENCEDPAFQQRSILDWSAIRRRAEALCAQYDVRGPGIDAPAKLLSGGNIQKLILARVFESNPRLILANQPTRGLDMGAASSVAERLLSARENGAGVLLISEDLDELLSLSDRILVMRDGALTETASFERNAIGLLMAGDAA